MLLRQSYKVIQTRVRANCVNCVTANSAIVPCVDGHNGHTRVVDSAQDLAPQQATTDEGNFPSFVLDQINLVIKEVKDKRTTKNSFIPVLSKSEKKKQTNKLRQQAKKDMSNVPYHFRDRNSSKNSKYEA